jgi:asparagine synthase (glutamine-hydrolysing)
MCDTLRHRGPDDEGIYVDGPLGMGMRRLSIIDLSTGKQPIRNEDGAIWTVYNGEIYNFPELRASLEAKGHRFYTHTDTEVIVHLYEEYQEEFVTHLAGMFAIALWDTRQKKLLLVRDRVGIKPLYYSVGLDRLVFGSEIKALLQDGVPRDIDPQALHDYLSFNYIPGPRTIFSHIRKLPPGHLLTCKNGDVKVRPYWELHYQEDARQSGTFSEEEYCEALHDLLKTTVKQHLISDVPLGVFLSGGIDSSSLVALMREVSAQTIQTFSIGFSEQSYNELAYARVIAKAFATDHHELVVRPQVIDLLPELIRYFDEPFADSTAIPVYCVAKLAREHVKVALSGEGGDEVFAGYETYAAYKFAALYQRLPRFLTSSVIPAMIRRLPVSHNRISFDYKAKRFVNGALLPPVEGHYWWKVIFTEEAKAALYADGGNGSADPVRLYHQVYEQCAAADILTKILHIDLKIYLPDYILVKADRMSMATSLEARVPFLDHRVVEFAATLPPHLKLRGLTQKKYILRKAMARHLPEQILHGKKRGFNVPIPVWLRGELRDVVHDVLSPRRVKEMGLFNPETVSSLIADHEAMRVDCSRNIWSLLIFSLWYDEYIRRPPAAR